MKIDTETIMVNLLKEDKKRYCTLERVQSLCEYIYKKLREENVINEYTLKFEVDFESIERVVLYNNRIFKLNIEDEIIYLREEKNVDDLARRFPADERIKGFIHEFNQRNVA